MTVHTLNANLLKVRKSKHNVRINLQTYVKSRYTMLEKGHKTLEGQNNLGKFIENDNQIFPG